MDILPNTLALWISTLGAWLLELGLIFVLLFWMVGAYNRLMRLRQAVAAAWVQIDELLVRRAVVLDSVLSAVQVLLVAESASLQALKLAHEQQRQAAIALRAKPASARHIKAWLDAELAQASPLARFQALVEQQEELASHEVVQPARKSLAEIAQRLGYARQLFNDAGDAYNTAVGEFPTRLLTGMFGFARVTRL